MEGCSTDILKHFKFDGKKWVKKFQNDLLGFGRQKLVFQRIWTEVGPLCLEEAQLTI